MLNIKQVLNLDKSSPNMPLILQFEISNQFGQDKKYFKVEINQSKFACFAESNIAKETKAKVS